MARPWRKAPVDPAQLDPNMVRLVEALNSFEAIRTIASCGGHPNPTGCQSPEGTFCVFFRPAPTRAGWGPLEFLVWLIGDYRRSGHHVDLIALSPPPQDPVPGGTMYFCIDGSDGEDPDALADWILRMKEEEYDTSPRSRRRG
jgi:hypothetical protein